MKLSIQGLKETISNLNAIDKAVGNAEEPMRQATLILTGAARREAPVDRGVLRGSIMPSVTSSGTTTTGIVGSNLAYAPFQELGTRPFWPPIAALETWARRHGIEAFLVARAISRRGIKAKRYLQKALDSNASRIASLFNAYIARVVKR